jgi:hypothetical protein
MTSKQTVLAALAIAAMVAVLSGCGTTTTPAAGSSASSASPPAASPSQQAAESNPPGDIPDNQAFVVYTAADHSFAMKYPEGWARTDSGSNVTFSDKFNSITMVPREGFYQPTEDFARTVELPEIAAGTPGFAPGNISTVQRSAGPVVLITYQGDSAPSPVTGKSIKQDVQRYEFANAGRGVVVTLSAPAGSDTVDPWRVVTDSFTWLP